VIAVVGVAASLLFALVPAGAQAHKRSSGHEKALVVEQRYDHPWGVRTWHFPDATLDSIPEPPGLMFTPRAGDRYVHITVMDDSGEDAMVRVIQTDPPRAPREDWFCLKEWTGRLMSHNPVEVKVYGGACEDHTMAFPTQGMVMAKFSDTGNVAPTSEHHHQPY
jgi:hypothetical protein